MCPPPRSNFNAGSFTGTVLCVWCQFVCQQEVGAFLHILDKRANVPSTKNLTTSCVDFCIILLIKSCGFHNFVAWKRGL